MRVLTRADLDGVVAAAMIGEMEDVHQIVFAHPRDIEDGMIQVEPGDAIANLPYAEGCVLWFDHHHAAEHVMEMPAGVKGNVGVAPSAARLVFDYYKSIKLERYRGDLLDQTDRLDSASLTYEDVLKPQGWIQIGMTLDPRAGMANYDEYSLNMINMLMEGKTITEIMEDASVKGHIKKMLSSEHNFMRTVINLTHVRGTVSVTDFREMEEPPVGNRFLVYALYTRTNVNVRVLQHRDVGKLVVAVGKSIFDKSCKMHIGELMEEFGGGGLSGAGTFPVKANEADEKIALVINKLNQGNVAKFPG